MNFYLPILAVRLTIGTTRETYFVSCFKNIYYSDIGDFKVQDIVFEVGGKKHHDHMICDECGDIIEFCDETIEELQSKIAKKYGMPILSLLIMVAIHQKI